MTEDEDAEYNEDDDLSSYGAEEDGATGHPTQTGADKGLKPQQQMN